MYISKIIQAIMNTPINKKRNAFICLVDRDIKKKKTRKSAWAIQYTYD